MKRSYFYFAASALMLSACTSEAVLDDQVRDSKEIGFENVVQKLSRQGDVTDLTGNDLASFQVFGYYTMPENDQVANMVFDNTTVTRSGNTWSHNDTKRYWVPGAKYYFYAYSCGDKSKMETGMGTFTFDMEDNLTVAQRELKINDFLCNHTHQDDLIFATNTTMEGKEKDNDLVAFQFKHILSKVNAMFTSAFPEEYEVIISDVTIRNIRDCGNYSPTAGWTGVDRRSLAEDLFVYLLDTSDASVDALKTSATGNSVKTNSAFVLPYTYEGEKTAETNTYVSLEFVLNVQFKGEKVLTKKLVGEFNPDWQAGYTYTYNVTLDGDAAGLEVISFTTAKDEDGNEVSGWEQADPIKFEIVTIDTEETEEP